MNNEHITELIDYLCVHPMWRTLNFAVFQNSFVVYIGPYDKDTMTKSWSDYLEEKKSLNDDERTTRKVGLDFILTDDHSRCRGLVCWHNKKYRPGRTHFMFVFADTVKRDSELFGVIAHEATHCMDYIMNECNLDRISGPGPSETAAFIMQFIIRKIHRWFDEIVPPPTPAPAEEPEPQPTGESTGEDTPVSEPVPVDSGHRPRHEKKKSVHPGAAMESQWNNTDNPYRDIDNLMTAINNTDHSRMIWSSCTGQKIPPCLEDPEIMSPWLQLLRDTIGADEIRKRIVAFLALRSTNNKNVFVGKVGEDLMAFAVKKSPLGSLASDICMLSDLQEASKHTRENYLITLSPKLHLATNERMYGAECHCTTAPVMTDALTFIVKLHGNEGKPELFSPKLISIMTGIGRSEETIIRASAEYALPELWDKAVNKHEPLTMEEAECMRLTSIRILPQSRS